MDLSLRIKKDKLISLVYMGFRARLHQRSMAPVWNDFVHDDQSYPGMDGWEGPKFTDPQKEFLAAQPGDGQQVGL